VLPQIARLEASQGREELMMDAANDNMPFGIDYWLARGVG